MIRDDEFETAEVTDTINLLSGNQPPQPDPNAAQFTVMQDDPDGVEIVMSPTDPEGHAMTFFLMAHPLNGELLYRTPLTDFYLDGAPTPLRLPDPGPPYPSCNAQGCQRLFYIPDPGFHTDGLPPDSIEYLLVDSQGASGGTHTIEFVVLPTP